MTHLILLLICYVGDRGEKWGGERRMEEELEERWGGRREEVGRNLKPLPKVTPGGSVHGHVPKKDNCSPDGTISVNY